MTSVKNDEGILRYEHTADKFGARPTNPDTALASAVILDHGHVILLSTYGSDLGICEAARVSYGKGTVAKREPVALLRNGTGKMSHDFHLSTLSGFKDVQCVAVCDVDTTRREHAKKFIEDQYAMGVKASQEAHAKEKR